MEIVRIRQVIAMCVGEGNGFEEAFGDIGANLISGFEGRSIVLVFYDL